MSRADDRRVARPRRARRQDLELPDWSLGDLDLGVAPEPNGNGRQPVELSRRELELRREYLCEYVRGSFEGVLSEEDVEDAVQSAWVAVIARRGDEPIRDLRAFMGSTAWRTANEYVRRPPPLPIDPGAEELADREDVKGDLPNHVAERARVARIAEALAQLSPPLREAMWARFVEELDPDQACELLGISRQGYFKRIKAALERVEQVAGYRSPDFNQRQRQLLSDYVAGVATEEQRVRAERLIASDPYALAIARELRRTHETAALLLPVCGFGAGDAVAMDGPMASVTARVSEAVSGWLGRTPASAEIASSPAVASGGARGAGVAGAGVLAKTFGGLGASKVALGCLGGGAVATIACFATGALPLPGGDEPKAKRGARSEKAVRAPALTPPAQLPALVEAEPSARTAQRREEPDAAEESEPPSEGSESRPTPESAPTLEPDTAPEVQEFGVAGAGTPVGGAPPDTNDANGASASAVRQEFGP